MLPQLGIQLFLVDLPRAGLHPTVIKALRTATRRDLQTLPLTTKQSISKTSISTPLETDPSVKVVVRIRPTSNIRIGDETVKKLGHVVDALTKETSSGKAEVPNKNSCLTRLLHESLGGNAKLSVICSIYPDNKNNGETLRTLRFGQRVRSIQNEPVINEIKEDDVNDLSDQIRQLRRLKFCGRLLNALKERIGK
ncbi:unnamed protein product [Vicia faba]|uniref:Kinesin motor domain-containing protein n=1 Tax=Vicia faba TaxID=3906 RepID=A0AAV1ADU4_VICFA|nr:unnamed protein product [Vicia faba]